MTQLVINYVVNPFSRIFKAIQHAMEIRGMVHVAEEMYRLGYMKEYQDTVQRIRQMQEAR